MRKSSSSLLLLSCALLSACAQAPAPAELRVVVTGESGTSAGRDVTLDFGATTRGDSRQLPLVVQNVGASPLTLTGFDFVQGDAVRALPGVPSDAPVFSVTLDGEVVVAAGAQRELTVTFTPPTDQQQGPAFEAVLTLRASGPPAGADSARLTLRGTTTEASLCSLPAAVDFGAVARGDALIRGFTVRNPGPTATTLTLEAPQPGGVFSFAPGNSAGTVTLAPGGWHEVLVAFQPTAAGAASAELTVSLAGCPAHRVQLGGEGVDQLLSWTPASVDFGYVPPGASTERELTFTNLGFRPVAMSDLAFFDGAVPSTVFSFPSGATTLTVPGAIRGADGVLAPGTATLRLGFAPNALGARPGTVRANTDLASQSSIIVPLRAIGGGPAIEVSPPQVLDLGPIAYFAGLSPPMATTARLAVRNVGTRPNPPDARANLKLGVASASGDITKPYWEVTARNAITTVDELCVGAFDDAMQTCLGDLAPADYDPNLGLVAGQPGLALPVRAQPRGLGPKEWELTLFSNDLRAPMTTVLITAQSVTMPPCQLQVTPTVLRFGLVAPGEDKRLTVHVKNLGTQPGETCLVSNLAVTPGARPPPNGAPAFSLVDPPAQTLTLQPGELRELTVRAAPRGAWPATPTLVDAVLSFTVSSPTAPVVRVDASAEVGRGCLVLVPEAWDFGTVASQCGSAPRDVTLYNDCAAPVTVDAVELALLQPRPVGTPGCPGPQPCPEFSLANLPTLPATLAAGATLTGLQLRYQPLDVGADEAALRVRSTENGQPREAIIVLRGRGDANGANTDVFALPRKADVLFVIDDSGTLYDRQVALSRTFGELMQFATAHQLDYQLGVTTTDTPTNTGRLRAPNGVRLLTSATVNPQQVFDSLINVGNLGSASETCLEPAAAALSWPLITEPAANQGLLRPDATLGIVCMTDAWEQTPRPPWVVHELLRRVKGTQRPLLMSYSVIGPFLPTAPQGCLYDGPGDAWGRHAAAAAALHGRTEEICSTDWPNLSARIGRVAFGERDRFFLTARPDATITPQVTVDGVAAPASAWTWEPISNAVVFDPNFLPAPGQRVEVQYQVACVP